ncbi:MAG: hypothetical protein IJE88_04830, partial [Akkermansia sp.]|nr:hypothetical protein [Akkermansia sp.]
IVIGARDFSPEITVHLIGTSVFALRATPRQESPVLRQSSSPANSNLLRRGGFYKNAVDISIANKIFGTHVTHVRQFAGLNFSCLLLEEK